MKGSLSAKGRLPIKSEKDQRKWTRLVNLIKKMRGKGLKTSLDIVGIYNRYKESGDGERDYPKSSLKMWQKGRKAYEDRKADLTRRIK